MGQAMLFCLSYLLQLINIYIFHRHSSRVIFVSILVIEFWLI